jgi:hypothetical protein
VPGDVTLLHESGVATVRELDDGRRRISVEPVDARVFVPRREWETRYSLDLIEHVLEVKGVGGLRNEIARDESDNMVALYLHHGLLSYLPPEAFRGKRLLDFGSGSGASTLVLARMFPQAEIVGVELDSRLIELARHRADFHRARTFASRCRPAPTRFRLASEASISSYSARSGSICCLTSAPRSCLGCGGLWGRTAFCS